MKKSFSKVKRNLQPDRKCPVMVFACMVCILSLVSCAPEEFESDPSLGAVDLGLSVMWANCNVGASSPEGYGDYFAWGETEVKDSYYWENYKYFYGDKNGNGYVDEDELAYINNDISGTHNDIASSEWGNGWRMPTLEEIQELVDECSWRWTKVNGVAGYRVTGPNYNSIFLPAAGYRDGDDFYEIGVCAYYWAATLYSEDIVYANCVGFESEDDAGVWYYSARKFGNVIRPVKKN